MGMLSVPSRKDAFIQCKCRQEILLLLRMPCLIMQMENVSYGEAVEVLAKKAGVQLKYTQNGIQNNAEDPKSRLKDEYKQLYTRITSSFHYMLMETEGGKMICGVTKKEGNLSFAFCSP